MKFITLVLCVLISGCTISFKDDRLNKEEVIQGFRSVASQNGDIIKAVNALNEFVAKVDERLKKLESRK